MSKFRSCPQNTANYTKSLHTQSSTAVLRNCSGFIYWCESGKKVFQFAAGFDCERHRMPFSWVKSVGWLVKVSAYMRVNRDKNTKTVLVLANQAEANGAAQLFVLGEGPFRVRRRGETRRVKRRLGIGQDAVLGRVPRRRFKSRTARLPRRRFRGRAGRR